MAKVNEIKQTSLYHFLEKSRTILEKKPHIYKQFSNNFKRIQNIVEKPIRLAVLGEFSSGKSSFINRLIGKDILPTGITPITSAITVLQYGEKEKVEVIYKETSGNIFLKEYEGYEILEPLNKQIQEENDLIDIQEIRVFVNNDLLNYFNILDTPGFNDPNKLGEKVVEIFEDINFVIWLFTANQAGKGTEQKYLEKFVEKSHYKNNLYAIITFGDNVVNSNDDYDKQFKIINDDLKQNFGKYFINEKKFLISCTEKNDFWNKKFDELVNDLKKKGLSEDKKISMEQLKTEYDGLIDTIKKCSLQISEISKEIESEVENFINEEIGIKIKKRIEENIKETKNRITVGITNIINKLKPILENKYLDSLVKFASFYFTAEELEIMCEDIKKTYYNCINEYQSSYNEFKKCIDNYLKEKSTFDEKFQENIIKQIEIINFKLDFLSNTNQLLIIGCIIGILLDDYIYKNLHIKDDIINRFNFGIIKTLLNMDYDFSYFENEVQKISEKLKCELNNNIELLKKGLESLEEFKDLKNA